MPFDAELLALGFRAEFAAAEMPVDGMYARVARIERGHAQLWAGASEYDVDLSLYSQPHDIAVGDWLLLQAKSGQLLPIQRLPRVSLISRRASGERADEQLIAANIDTLFIVSSCNQDFSLGRLERYLALALEAKVRPVVVLTKADQVESTESYLAELASLGNDLDVVCLNALDATAVQQLADWCGPGQTVAMVGSSGVGKSTLTNQLLGDVVQLTQQARSDDAKGRHTTTSRSMLRMQNGGLIIDTPGMREVQLPSCEQGLQILFADVIAYLGHCRFNDCRHEAEPGCAVQAAIQSGELDERRWLSYRKLHEEQAANRESMEARRASSQKLTRSYRKYQKQARGNKGKRG